MTIEQCAEIAIEINKKFPSKKITMKTILIEVAIYFNLQANSIKERTRKREIVQARQICMFFAKENKQSSAISLRKIGEYYGGYDHATVIHACKTVANLCYSDKKYRNQIKEIEKIIKSNE